MHLSGCSVYRDVSLKVRFSEHWLIKGRVGSRTTKTTTTAATTTKEKRLKKG